MARRSRERSRLLARAASSVSSPSSTGGYLFGADTPATSSLCFGFSKLGGGGSGGLFSSPAAAAPPTSLFRSFGTAAGSKGFLGASLEASGRYDYRGKQPTAPLSITFSSPREALGMDIGHHHGRHEHHQKDYHASDSADEPLKKKDVPFIDFLGVGVSS